MSDILSQLTAVSAKRRITALVEKLKAGKVLSAKEHAELGRLERSLKGKATKAPRDERKAQAELMARKRAADREIVIDFSRQNMRRRNRCMKSPELFMRTYFPDIFYMPFSDGQQVMIEHVKARIIHGGMQALAAPRGGGKTTLSKGLIIWGFSYGYLRWVPWIEANLDLAESSVEDIKLYYADPHGKDYFRDDFPEYCDPIRALDGESRRARLMTYGHKRVKIDWGAGKIALPTIDAADTPHNTPAFGGMIQAFGAEKPIRGLVHQSLRPDFAMINDVETEDTVKSVAMTESIRRNIEKAVKGLAGPGEKLGIVMLCTIIRWGCLADQFTDRNKYPQWHGVRQQMIEHWPHRLDLWDHYMHRRKKDQRAGDEKCKSATAFYRENREAMDAGAVMNNPRRYERGAELSALQHAFNLIADMGMENFQCEYQNDPPEELSGSEMIQPERVTEKLSGIQRGVAPSWTEKVTGFVDVHDQKLYWSIVAWRQGLTGVVLDYGVDAIQSPVPGSVTADERDKAVDSAIMDGLRAIKARFDGGIKAEEKESRRVNFWLVDAGYRTETVIRFCRETVGWLPSKGGTSRSGVYTAPKPKTQNLIGIGPSFHVSWLPVHRSKLVIFDPDHAKKRVHEGFLIGSSDADGSLSVFGDDPTIHRAFAEQITAEAYNIESQKFEPVPGRTHNHWLDCVVGCWIGAVVCGLRLFKDQIRKAKQGESQPATAPAEPVNTGIRSSY